MKASLLARVCVSTFHLSIAGGRVERGARVCFLCLPSPGQQVYTPDQNQGRPTVIRLIPAVLILCISLPSFGEDYIEFIDRAERFGVNFPGQPMVRDITYLSEQGSNLPARLYSVQSASGRYSVTVVNYMTVDATFVRASIAWAAWTIRKRGGDITYDAFAQVDRIEGHQLQITNADKSRTFVAIHLHARRLYILEATVPPNSVPPALFQQSLRILDENGTQIRYNLDADGNRTTRIR